YIAPSLSQLYGSFGANPALEPEEDRTLAGGLEYSSGIWRLSGLYFNRSEKKYIFYGNEGYVNIEERYTVNGVETELSVKPVGFVQLDANYTFTENRDQIALRIPKHKVNATAGFTLCPTTFASVSYQYVDDRLDSGEILM